VVLDTNRHFRHFLFSIDTRERVILFNRKKIHIGNVGIKGKHFSNNKFDNNLIERLNGTVKDRNKTQRGLKSEETSFIKGHQLYYNFIKSHEGLNGYTPAHFANIYLDLKDRKWENLLLTAVKDNKLIKNEKYEIR
jgi:hypothetical protein